MIKISKLADKFSMKLSLESRPASSPDPSYQQVGSDELLPDDEIPEDISSQELKYLNKKPYSDVRYYLDNIRTTIHNLGLKIDLGDFEPTLEIISDANYDLHQLEEIVKHQISKSASLLDRFAANTLPYDGKFLDSQLEELPNDYEDEDDNETVFYDVSKEKLPIHLPAALKEYLKELDYMDRNQLSAEHKRLLHLTKQFAQDGHKSARNYNLTACAKYKIIL